jgi:hypothetical protein
MLLGFGLSLLFSVALCLHVLRTGQQSWWIFIILLFQPLGGLIYLAAVVVPELVAGPARKLSAGAREVLDPGREYREAKAGLSRTDSVAARMRLARAAAASGRPAEAEALWREAARGVHAEDPVIQLGRAQALADLGRFEEAMPLAEPLAREERSPAATLTLARIYEGLGRMSEAEAAYDWAAGRMPGLEGLARHAAFLARTGRRGQAQEIVAEIDRHLARTNPKFRKEGRAWRELARQALAQAGPTWP